MASEHDLALSREMALLLAGVPDTQVTATEGVYAWRLIRWEADVPLTDDQREALLEGVDTVEKAQVLRGKMLYVDRKDLKLPKGHYLVQDLIGLTIVDADTGETYGTLTDVSQTGANAVYHMATDKGEVLIPAIPDVVIEIDFKKDILRLRPMKGLLDDDEI